MKSKSLLSGLILFIVALLTTGNGINAQTKENGATIQDLYKEIARMDSVLFTAFNNRDLEKIKTIFSTDAEFFHDKGGLTHYPQIIENTKQLFERSNGPTRELIAGSMEVYPINDYGAIQTGKHRFCHIENGKNECGIFKFLHIWKKKDNVWTLNRVVSYDH